MRYPGRRREAAELVGRRVIVRHRLHNHQFSATDVLGTLQAWTPDGARVRRDRGGDVVHITPDDIIVIKEIPERTVTRRDVRDLEAAAAGGWVALEAEWLGGWLLRASGGFTGRGNSCLPLDDPGMPVGQAVEAVEAWYAQRRLPALFQIPEPLGQVLGPQLDARGWSAPFNRTTVMTAVLDDVRHGARDDLPEVRVEDTPDQAWLDAYHYRGGSLPDHAVDVLVNAATVGFASIDEDGERVAIARGAVSTAPSGRCWLGLTAVEVAPGVRRRGLGRHVVAGLAAWAAGHGANEAYLQVTESNTAAQATYRRIGFTEHHAYHYRSGSAPQTTL